MIITKRSILSGKLNSMDLEISAEQLIDYTVGIAPIQRIFPEMPAAQREFLINGITPEEWDSTFLNLPKNNY